MSRDRTESGYSYHDDSDIADSQSMVSMIEPPLHIGELKKEGLKNKSIKSRIFILQRNFLFYFAPNKIPVAKGACVLTGCTISKTERKSRPYCVSISLGDGQPMVISFPTQSVQNQWHDALSAHVETQAPIKEDTDLLSPDMSMNVLLGAEEKGLFEKLGDSQWRGDHFQERYFVLQNGILVYFGEKPILKPLGSIPVKSCSVEQEQGGKGKYFPFKIATTGRTYFLRADSAMDRDLWTLHLEQNVEWHHIQLQRQEAARQAAMDEQLRDTKESKARNEKQELTRRDSSSSLRGSDTGTKAALGGAVVAGTAAGIMLARQESVGSSSHGPRRASNAAKSKGSFQVRVHVIEGRDLQARGNNGRCDPVCIATLLPAKTSKSTRVFKKKQSCVWDEPFVFHTGPITKTDLETYTLRFEVKDDSRFGSKHLIGQYEFGIATTYAQEDHEYYRQWVGLSDPSGQFQGLQGYLRVSVTVLGPGDHAPVHADEDVRSDEGGSTADLAGMVLLPPEIKFEPWRLSLCVYRAKISKRNVSMLKSLDPYVSVEFAGNKPIKTEKKKGKNDPEWNTELRIPFMRPCMSETICVKVMNSNMMVSDDELCEVHLSLADVFDDKLSAPRNFPMYTADGRNYAGEIVLSATAEESYAEAMAEVARSASRTPPTCSRYTCQLHLYEGREFPTLIGQKVFVEVQIGNTAFQCEPQSLTKGAVQFYTALEQRAIEVPDDLSQAPDIFVNAYIRLAGGVRSQRFAYARYPASEIVASGTTRNPVWHLLDTDPLHVQTKRYQVPGYLLFDLMFAKDGVLDPVATVIPRPIMSTFQLRLFLYQAMDLPAADESSFSDPYVKAKCGAVSVKSKTIDTTLNPRWYQTLVMKVELPSEDMALAQDLELIIKDDNKIKQSVYLCRATCALRDASYDFTRPQWQECYTHKIGSFAGRILFGVQLVPWDTAKYLAIPDITPEMIDVMFEIHAIGLRDLIPSGFDTNETCIEFDCGDRSDETKVVCTRYSKTPTTANPNFSQVLYFPLRSPTDPLFCPTINVRVYEKALVGMKRALLATAALPLAPFLVEFLDKQSATKKKDDIPALKPAPAPRQRKDDDADLEKGMDAPLLEMQDFGDGDYDDENDDWRDRRRSSSEGLRTFGADDFDLSMATDNVHHYVVADKNDPLDRARLAGDAALVDETPFSEYDLYRGSASRFSFRKRLWEEFQQHVLLHNKDEAEDQGGLAVGRFKGRFQLGHTMFWDKAHVRQLEDLFRPQVYVIRVYVLRAMNLVTKNQSPTVYTRVRIGGKLIDDTENAVKDAGLTCDFYKCHQAEILLPGNSELTVEMRARNMLGVSEPIGATVIDLEDRVFSNQWRMIERKPIECRTLWPVEGENSAGTVEMWVEAMTQEEASRNPPYIITPPPPQPFELRVIIWRTKEVVTPDKSSVDIRVSGCWLETPDDRQKTDIHWNAKDGTGEFNWRLIYPLTLPSAIPRLQLQLWDKDLLTPDQALADNTLNLAALLRKAHKSGKSQQVSKQWLTMTSPNHPDQVRGKVEISVELLTQADAESDPVGPGNDGLPAPDRPEDALHPFRIDRRAALGMRKFGRSIRGWWRKRKWLIYGTTFLGVVLAIVFALWKLGIIGRNK